MHEEHAPSIEFGPANKKSISYTPDIGELESMHDALYSLTSKRASLWSVALDHHHDERKMRLKREGEKTACLITVLHFLK